MGRRTAAPDSWLCSVDAVPVTSVFPAVWVSDVDATDEAAGIHCGPIPFDLTSRAFRIARSITTLLP